MDRPIRVGTRKSTLAMAQSKIIIDKIRKKYPKLSFELVGISTKGDAILDKRLDLIGGKGLFVNEIEVELLKGNIDLAVHSMKDMPSFMPEELCIAAVSEREDPRDVLITLNGTTLSNLKEGAVVGTSSIRREVQLLKLRPDIEVKELRGNVLTRLDKLMNNEYDAIILAAAGLIRLGLKEKCTEYFSIEEMIPAVGQGILGVQIRKGGEIEKIVKSINCPDSAHQLEAERAFMTKLNGGCSIPIAAYATIYGNNMKILGMLSTDENKEGFRAIVEGEKKNSRALGEELADIILGKMGKIV